MTSRAEDRSHQLLHALADGQFHSGETLAGVLGVTRAAVWKKVHALEKLGLSVFRVPGRGYRLADPLQLLDAAAITAASPAKHRVRLERDHRAPGGGFHQHLAQQPSRRTRGLPRGVPVRRSRSAWPRLGLAVWCKSVPVTRLAFRLNGRRALLPRHGHRHRHRARFERSRHRRRRASNGPTISWPRAASSAAYSSISRASRRAPPVLSSAWG